MFKPVYEREDATGVPGLIPNAGTTWCITLSLDSDHRKEVHLLNEAYRCKQIAANGTTREY